MCVYTGLTLIDLHTSRGAYRDHSESEQRTVHAVLIYYSNKITLTKPPSFSVPSRCLSSHPNACDICSYSHLQIYHATMSPNEMKELTVFPSLPCSNASELGAWVLLVPAPQDRWFCTCLLQETDHVPDPRVRRFYACLLRETGRVPVPRARQFC